MTFADVAKLTRWQIQNVLFYPIDYESEFSGASESKGTIMPYETIFKKTWLHRGFSEAEVEKKWQEYLAEERAKKGTPHGARVKGDGGVLGEGKPNPGAPTGEARGHSAQPGGKRPFA